MRLTAKGSVLWAERYMRIVISGHSAIIAEPAENIVIGDAAHNATQAEDALSAPAKTTAGAAEMKMILII